MTRIEIAPELVEEAVFLLQRDADRRGDLRATLWLEQREPLYELRDPREREAAFLAHALLAFRTLHLDEPLSVALEACPAARERLDVLAVRRARRTKEEGAELYSSATSARATSPTRAVLALKPDRFAELDRLHEHVRRELLFIDDMLEPAFEYDPCAIDALDLDPGMRDVVRDRASRAWRRRIDVRARGERVTGTFVELVESAVASLGGTRASSGA
ncbi:MAG: hypothetical protein IT454_10255 [Planctomycetes bacterium]|nr:hypothetical protein [Planctomycetota bacterium]